MPNNDCSSAHVESHSNSLMHLCIRGVRCRNRLAPGKKTNYTTATMVQTYHVSGGTIAQLKTAVVKNVPTMGLTRHIWTSRENTQVVCTTPCKGGSLERK